MNYKNKNKYQTYNYKIIKKIRYKFTLI